MQKRRKYDIFEEDRTVTPEDVDNENYFDDIKDISGTPSKDEKKVKTSVSNLRATFLPL